MREQSNSDSGLVENRDGITEKRRTCFCLVRKAVTMSVRSNYRLNCVWQERRADLAPSVGSPCRSAISRCRQYSRLLSLFVLQPPSHLTAPAPWHHSMTVLETSTGTGIQSKNSPHSFFHSDATQPPASLQLLHHTMHLANHPDACTDAMALPKSTSSTSCGHAAVARCRHGSQFALCPCTAVD